MIGVIIFCSLIYTLNGQELISPCPRLFIYEPRKANENDRWYGQMTVIGDADLSGLWIRVVLDKSTIQLGNWFGSVERRGDNEYLIKNPTYKLPANTPLNIRFYIKYNPNEAPPKLLGFRLNAKTICPEESVTTVPPVTSGFLNGAQTTPSSGSVNAVFGGLGVGLGGGSQAENVRPSSPISPGEGRPVYVKPGGGGLGQGIDEDDDFFSGDFSFLNKPGASPAFSEPACGKIVSPPRPLITHGQATNEGEFPWHAAIYHAKGIDLSYICGASLISKRHLITVAHCVTRKRTQSTLSPDSLVVYLGKYYLKRWSNPGIQDRPVEKIICHPKYNSQTFEDDIAILKLNSDVEITNFVRPVCLWEGSASLDPVIEKLGVVVGWGFDENGKVTEKLTKAHMPIVSQETCIFSFPDFFSRFTSTNTFCAGFRNGTSVCNGDSGGGLVLPKTEDKQVWQIRGMVSISVALQKEFRCDSTHYVVFTDVAKYIDWIKQNLR